MRLKSKAGAVLAAALVVVAVSAVPASAAGLPALPSVASLSGVCNSVKDPAAKSACNQAISAVTKCSSAKGSSALITCLHGSVKGITGSSIIPKGLNIKGLNIKGLLGQLGGGKLGGGTLGGFNISKLLSGLKL